MAIPVKETGNKVVVCGVCGAKFELHTLYHYIARDNGVTGLMTEFTREQEETIYDAFNCPHCGCQYIAQERKRTFYDDIYVVEPSDDDTETSDKAEETSDKEENPECEGCEGCEYDDDPQGNPFSMMCVSCRRLYTDKYTKKVN